MRQSIAPLFMLMKRTAAAASGLGVSDRLLGAFNDTEASKDFAGLSRLDLSQGKNLGLKGGRFEVVIVDEDSKIDVNMGASNEIAHIRLARELMGRMAPLQYDALFSRRDATGNTTDRLQIVRGAHRLGGLRRAALLVRHHRDAFVQRRGGRPLPEPAEAVPTQERALRLARRAAHGPRGRRRLLGHVRRPRTDRPDETPDDGVGAGGDQRQHRQRSDAAGDRLLRRGTGHGAVHRSGADAALSHWRGLGAGRVDGGAALRARRATSSRR